MISKVNFKKIMTLLGLLGMMVSLSVIGSSTSFAAKEITYMVVGAAPFSDVVLERLPEFEKQTGIKVKVVPVPHAHTFEKAIMETIGRTGAYDVIQIDRPMVAPFGEMGLLLPLGKYVSDTVINQFFDHHKKHGTFNGVLYALPHSNDIRALYYRTDLFAKAGIPGPPDTWEEWLDASIKTNELSPDVYGLLVAGFKGRGVWILSDFVYQAGSQILDENNNPAFNDAKGTKGLKFFVDMYRKYKILPPGTPDYIWQDTRMLFAKGVAAMVSEFNDIIPLLEDPTQSVVSGKYDLALLPKDERRGTNNGGWLVGIPVGTRNPKEAGKLIDWLLSVPIQKHMCYRSGTLSGNKAALQKIVAETELTNIRTDPRSQGRWKFYQEIMLTTYELPRTSAWPEISDILSEALAAALVGEKTPEQAFNDAAQEIKTLMGS